MMQVKPVVVPVVSSIKFAKGLSQDSAGLGCNLLSIQVLTNSTKQKNADYG